MDAAQLKGGIFASYKGGDMKSDANREFVRQFIEAAIPANERKSFTTDTGKIDSSGMARIEGAVIAHAYESKDMVNFLKAEADPVRKSIRNVLTQIAPAWSQMKEHVKAVDPKVDITQNLTDAITLIHRSIETGITLKDIYSQRTLLDADPLTSGERGERNRQVLKWFYKSDPFIHVREKGKKYKTQPKIASQADMLKRLSAWVSEVNDYNPGQEVMFGEPAQNPLKTLATAEVTEGKSLEEELAEQAALEAESVPGETEEKPTMPGQPLPSKRLSRRNKKAAPTSEEKLNTVMHRIADTVVPKGVLVNLQEKGSLGSAQGSEITGTYTRATMPWVAKKFPGGVINVAMRSTEPEATLHHEAVHALRQLHLFTRSEWKSLSDHVKHPETLGKIKETYPDLFTEKWEAEVGGY